jgi:hypothetical protein
LFKREDDDGANGGDFKGQRRSNDTHGSSTDAWRSRLRGFAPKGVLQDVPKCLICQRFFCPYLLDRRFGRN